MLIAAVSDVRSPRFYEEFVRAIENLTKQPDLFLMAGNMVERNEIDEYEKILNALFGKINCPIVACFGSIEYFEDREEIKRRFKEIRFLDDQVMVFEIKDKKVGIIGSLGCIAKPTQWQKSREPNIEMIYHSRLQILEARLRSINYAHLRILLLHYAPTYETLEGENPMFYETLGWNALESLLLKFRPEVVIHGHSFRGKKFAWVDRVPVFNVSFPLNKEIVLIDTQQLKPGLTKFV